MKTFLKENWFKILIGFIIIVAIASAGIFLFKKNKLSSFSASILKSFKDDKENGQSFQQQELEKARLELEMMKLELEEQKLESESQQERQKLETEQKNQPTQATQAVNIQSQQRTDIERQRLEIEQQQLQLLQEQQAQQEAQKAQNKSLLDACLANAQKTYDTNLLELNKDASVCEAILSWGGYARTNAQLYQECMSTIGTIRSKIYQTFKDMKDECYKKYPQ